MKYGLIILKKQQLLIFNETFLVWISIYYRSTGSYGYKQNLLQGFGLDIEKDGSFDKVTYHNQNNTIDTTHSIIFNYQNPDNRNNLGKLRPMV